MSSAQTQQKPWLIRLLSSVGLLVAGAVMQEILSGFMAPKREFTLGYIPPTEIVTKYATSQFRIASNDGLLLNQPCYSQKIQFWNSGQKSIDSGDIKIPISFRYANPSARILSIQPISSEQTKRGSWRLVANSQSAAYLVDFQFAESKASVAYEVLVSSPTKPRLVHSGTISEGMLRTRQLAESGPRSLGPTTAMFSFATILLIFLDYKLYKSKGKPEFPFLSYYFTKAGFLEQLPTIIATAFGLAVLLYCSLNYFRVPLDIYR